MEHNYELDNLTVKEVKTLDALFLLKDALIVLEPSKPVFIVPVTYTKGWTINYVETPIDDYKEIWALGSNLKSDESLQKAIDEGLQVFNYKATKDYTEYALVCNGVMYTFSEENKTYFANTFMKGSQTSVIKYNSNDDVKTKDEVAEYRKITEQFQKQTKDNIKAITKVINKANLKFAEEKLPLHIKYDLDDELTFISPVFMYKDLESDKLVSIHDCDLKWDEIYSKRRIAYSLDVRERTGKIRLHLQEMRRPDSKDTDSYIKECQLLSSNLLELAVVTSILKRLTEEYCLDFML